MKYVGTILTAAILLGLAFVLSGCGLALERHPIWADEAFDRQKNGT